MWKGEPSDLLVAKGYWKAVGAKLFHVVDKTFYLIPTDGGSCCHLDRLTSKASVERYRPTKNGGPTAVCQLPLR